MIQTTKYDSNNVLSYKFILFMQIIYILVRVIQQKKLPNGISFKHQPKIMFDKKCFNIPIIFQNEWMKYYSNMPGFVINCYISLF